VEPHYWSHGPKQTMCSNMLNRSKLLKLAKDDQFKRLPTAGCTPGWGETFLLSPFQLWIAQMRVGHRLLNTDCWTETIPLSRRLRCSQTHNPAKSPIIPSIFTTQTIPRHPPALRRLTTQKMDHSTHTMPATSTATTTPDMAMDHSSHMMSDCKIDVCMRIITNLLQRID